MPFSATDMAAMLADPIGEEVTLLDSGVAVEGGTFRAKFRRQPAPFVAGGVEVENYGPYLLCDPADLVELPDLTSPGFLIRGIEYRPNGAGEQLDDGFCRQPLTRA